MSENEKIYKILKRITEKIILDEKRLIINNDDEIEKLEIAQRIFAYKNSLFIINDELVK